MEFSLLGLGRKPSVVPLAPFSSGCWFKQDFHAWDLLAS